MTLIDCRAGVGSGLCREDLFTCYRKTKETDGNPTHDYLPCWRPCQYETKELAALYASVLKNRVSLLTVQRVGEPDWRKVVSRLVMSYNPGKRLVPGTLV